MKNRPGQPSWEESSQRPLTSPQRHLSRRTILLGGLGALAAASFFVGRVAMTLRQPSTLAHLNDHPFPNDPHLFLEIPVHESAAGTGLSDLAWSSDGQRIAFWDVDGIHLFHLPSGQLLWTYVPARSLEYINSGHKLAWFPQSNLLFGVDSTTFWALDTQRRQLLWTHPLPVNDPRTVTWSPDGRYCAFVVTQDPRNPVVVIWDSLKRRQSAVCAAPLYGSAGFYQLAWSPNGRKLASINEGGYIQLWPTSGGDSSQPFLTNYWLNLGNTSVDIQPWISWLPEGDVLASGYSLGEFSLWQVSTGKLLFQKKPFEGKYGDDRVGPAGVSFSPDKTRFTIFLPQNSSNLLIQVWSVQTRQLLFICQSSSVQIQDVSWSPNGNYLAASCSNGLEGSGIQIWDARNGKTLAYYRAPYLVSTRVIWSPDSRVLAGLSERSTCEPASNNRTVCRASNYAFQFFLMD